MTAQNKNFGKKIHLIILQELNHHIRLLYKHQLVLLGIIMNLEDLISLAISEHTNKKIMMSQSILLMVTTNLL